MLSNLRWISFIKRTRGEVRSVVRLAMIHPRLDGCVSPQRPQDSRTAAPHHHAALHLGTVKPRRRQSHRRPAFRRRFCPSGARRADACQGVDQQRRSGEGRTGPARRPASREGHDGVRRRHIHAFRDWNGRCMAPFQSGQTISRTGMLTATTSASSGRPSFQ